MKWAIWALLLVVQNFSFTMVSRARNSGSLGYHTLAAIFSNGVWIVSQFFLLDSVMSILKRGDWAEAVFVGTFYTLWTVVGSVSSHYVLMRWVETGKRRVGAGVSVG